MGKTLFFIFILVLASIVSSTSLSQNFLHKEKLYDSLKAELLAVYRTDQTIRLKLDGLLGQIGKEYHLQSNV